jgi:hypothetical protein
MNANEILLEMLNHAKLARSGTMVAYHDRQTRQLFEQLDAGLREGRFTVPNEWQTPSLTGYTCIARPCKHAPHTEIPTGQLQWVRDNTSASMSYHKDCAPQPSAAPWHHEQERRDGWR